MKQDKLTSREKDIIKIAINEALDNKDYKKGGCYEVLGDEMQEIRTKLFSFKTSRGNTLFREWQGWYGFDGSEYNLMQQFLDKGFQYLYCSASYHWALANPETLEIFSYTEGDTSLVKCKNLKSFKLECKDYVKFIIDNGYSPSSYGEGLEFLKEIEVEINE